MSAAIASFTRKVKEHPVVLLASLLVACVIGLAHFLGALDDIRLFISSQDSGARVSPADTAISPVTFDEYVRNAMTYSNMNQTRLQQREYIASLSGKRVIWRGEVLSVDIVPHEGFEVVLAHQHRLARFLFPPSDRIQLMALKPLDHVEISGVIDEWDVDSVSLQSSSLLSFTHTTPQ